MTKKRKSAVEVVTVTAVIDWNKTVDICADVSCGCGEGFHFDTRGPSSAQHARCPHCSKVVKLSEKVTLTSGEIDYDRYQDLPQAFIQWKGTYVSMTAKCICNREILVDNQDFAYELTCPDCKRCYNTEPYVLIDMLSSEEEKQVSVIHD